MLKDTKKIQDQYTDRSGRAFMKAAARIATNEERNKALEMFSNLPNRLNKLAEQASFPVNTPEDTYISRIYFEDEKHLMKEAEADDIEAKLTVREILFNIQSPEFKELEKTAEEEIELLPNVSIRNYSELQKIGEQFESDYRNLDYQDRIDFSCNFTKYACAEDIPESVKLYAGKGVALRPDAIEQLEFRKADALRIGKKGAMYEKIAEAIENTPADFLTDDNLWKLAEVVHNIDKSFGFTEPKYDKKMPDAWHAIMKQADEEEKENKISEDSTPTMSKSDIITRFGDQALDEVENEDGSIDETRLKRIMELFGDTKEKEKKNNV